MTDHADAASRDEMLQLALEIADAAARETIEATCPQCGDGGHLWWHTALAHSSDFTEQANVLVARRYLTLRSRLVEHADVAALVRFTTTVER